MALGDQIINNIRSARVEVVEDLDVMMKLVKQKYRQLVGAHAQYPFPARFQRKLENAPIDTRYRFYMMLHDESLHEHIRLGWQDYVRTQPVIRERELKTNSVVECLLELASNNQTVFADFTLNQKLIFRLVTRFIHVHHTEQLMRMWAEDETSPDSFFTEDIHDEGLPHYHWIGPRLNLPEPEYQED